MHARGEPEQEVAVGRSSAAHLSQAAADAAHEMSEHHQGRQCERDGDGFGCRERAKQGGSQ
jgi:hypothetical protein